MSTRGLHGLIASCLFATGCGCDDANLVGTVFAHDDGTSSISGIVTARGAPEDRQIEIMIAPEGTGARYGVIPDNLFDAPTTCGDTFRYEIRNLDPGSYKVLGKIEVPSGDASEYEGWFAGGASTVVVTVGAATAVPVGDGEAVTDVDFELINVLN
jgi:hypothetical protein